MKSINRKAHKECAKDAKKKIRTYTEEPSGSDLGGAKAGEAQRVTENLSIIFEFAVRTKEN